MTTLAKTTPHDKAALTAVAYRAHPATRPPGAAFTCLQQPRFWPPAWDGAARLLPLPAALDHLVAPEPATPEPVTVATVLAEPVSAEPIAPEPAIAEPAPARATAPEPARVAPARPELARPKTTRVEPVPIAPKPAAPKSPPEAPKRRLLWPAVGVVACVLAAAIGVAAWRQRPPPKVEIAASFKAPVLVLRASRPGVIDSFAVKPGEHVSPATVVLTLELPPEPDPMALAATDRVAAAQRRVDTLQTAAQQPVPQTTASHARMNDLPHQLEEAELDLVTAQDALSHLTPSDPTEMPIVAGAHGVVLSLEAQQGTQATVGTPLVRMADCDHGYVELDGPASLDPGSLVEVHLPNQPPTPAKLQPASRVSGPVVAMVAVPTPGAFAQACPLGTAGTVTPIPPAG